MIRPTHTGCCERKKNMKPSIVSRLYIPTPFWEKIHLGLQLDNAGHGVTMLPYCSLWLLRCHKRSGTEASRRGKNWKSACRPDMIRMIESQRFLMFFLTLDEQNRVTAQAQRKFSLLSHTPSNRNECPCCKHFLTTPANTSILSLSLKNQNLQNQRCTAAKRAFSKRLHASMAVGALRDKGPLMIGPIRPWNVWDQLWFDKTCMNHSSQSSLWSQAFGCQRWFGLTS